MCAPPLGDISMSAMVALVLVARYGLKILLDITIAVGVGRALAGMLFILRTGDLTQTRPVRPAHDNLEDVPDLIDILYIKGSLFSDSAHKAVHSVTEVTPQVRVITPGHVGSQLDRHERARRNGINRHESERARRRYRDQQSEATDAAQIAPRRHTRSKGQYPVLA